jgi:hypothetical protein
VRACFVQVAQLLAAVGVWQEIDDRVEEAVLV